MGARYLFKFAPRTAFHFGLRGVGVEETATTCPADTLFSALCLTLREWEGVQELEGWLARFPKDGQGGLPPLRLSSAFPYAGEVLFFPKPTVPANLPKATRQIRAKTLKKVEFVSKGILEAWLAQRDLNGELADDQLLHGGQVWVTRQELSGLSLSVVGKGNGRMWEVQTLPRVTIDRMTSRSAVYQAGVVRFAEGAGLYTLVEFLGGDTVAAATERERLKTLFQVLGDGGLGGERSSGYGQFTLQEPMPFAGWAGAEGPLFLTLSPYHPTPQEVAGGVLDEGASYTLLTRRGWVGSPEGSNLRRRMVRLLAEGSVLQHPKEGAGPSYGDLADVTPYDGKGQPALGHPVWRYGIAFPLPAAQPVTQEEGA